MKLAVVTAGLSQPSSSRLLADRLASATASALGPTSVSVLELRDIALDVTKNLLTGFPNPALRSAIVFERVTPLGRGPLAPTGSLLKSTSSAASPGAGSTTSDGGVPPRTTARRVPPVDLTSSRSSSSSTRGE